MCTAATYKTKDFYFGRTLDYEFSYGDEITITPRNFPFKFRHTNECNSCIIIIYFKQKFIDTQPTFLRYSATSETAI